MGQECELCTPFLNFLYSKYGYGWCEEGWKMLRGVVRSKAAEAAQDWRESEQHTLVGELKELLACRYCYYSAAERASKAPSQYCTAEQATAASPSRSTNCFCLVGTILISSLAVWSVMPGRRGLLAPQNTFLDTIATRFDGTHSNFVLGNAQVPHHAHPIVYCSDGFCELTGFTRAQIMQKGCACRFLWGADTSEEHRQAIEMALQTKSELKIEVIFYKKNGDFRCAGSPFWCQLDIVPIKNEKREVVLFLASHKDITGTKMASMHSGSSGTASLIPNPALQSPEDDEAETPSASQMGRRRSRAVLYQLSGHYKHQEKIKPKIKISNSLLTNNPAPLPEYTSSSVKRSRLVLSHYGLLKGLWDWLVVLATVYVAVAVPFLAAFMPSDSDRDTRSLIPDVAVEALFIGDIVLNFRTTYVNRKGEVVTDDKSIALNYLRGWFIVDLLAAIPFDLLYASEVYTSQSSQAQFINLLKLTRLLRLARVLQKMDRYSQYSAMILTLLMLSFTLVAHWMACVWFVISDRERRFHEPEWNLGWLTQLASKRKIPVDKLSQWDCYVTALYFTCSSLTSVGFGNVSANTTPEKVFSICIMLIGALMHAVVFGNVTAIIQRLYSRRSLYQARWTDLKEFLALAQVPKDLKQRIEDYFQTSWSVSNGIDMNEILKEFPEELRGDVSMHLHREVLQLPIFNDAPQGCLKLLSLHIKSTFCAPGEFLVHKGDALHYIYYLCHGSMEVQEVGSLVVAILGTGDLVGCDIPEECNCGQVTKSSCAVKALTYCDLKCINLAGLVEVLRLYPEFHRDFAHDILHDLTYNLREGYEAEPDFLEEEVQPAADTTAVAIVEDASMPLALPSITEAEEPSEEEGSSSASLQPKTVPSPPRGRFVHSKRCGLAHPVPSTSKQEPLVVEPPRDETDVERIQIDVALLAIEVRTALQTMQELAYPSTSRSIPLKAIQGSEVRRCDSSTSISSGDSKASSSSDAMKHHKTGHHVVEIVEQPSKKKKATGAKHKSKSVAGNMSRTKEQATQTTIAVELEFIRDELRAMVLANPQLTLQILREARYLQPQHAPTSWYSDSDLIIQV